MSILWVDFKCYACGKAILGHKDLKIKGKHYHMTCGIKVAKDNNVLNNMK